MQRTFMSKPQVQTYMLYDGTNLAEFEAYDWSAWWGEFTFVENAGNLDVYLNNNLAGTVEPGQWFNWGAVYDDIDSIVSNSTLQEVTTDLPIRYVVEEDI